MLNNNLHVKIFCISLVFFAQAKSAHACFFHGGYGNSPWPGFESRSNGMPSHYLSAEQANKAPPIKLSLPAMVRATVDKEEALTVSYTSEGEDPTIELLVATSPGIAVADNKISLTGKSGQHTFMLQPQASGIYRLIVTARDLTNKDIPALKEAVYVNIYENK